MIAIFGNSGPSTFLVCGSVWGFPSVCSSWLGLGFPFRVHFRLGFRFRPFFRSGFQSRGHLSLGLRLFGSFRTGTQNAHRNGKPGGAHKTEPKTVIPAPLTEARTESNKLTAYGTEAKWKAATNWNAKRTQEGNIHGKRDVHCCPIGQFHGLLENGELFLCRS